MKVWQGEERRSGRERRAIERRRMMPYRVHTVVIVDGVTWIDADGTHRRQQIRRRTDREHLANKILQYIEP